ncbi:nucleoside monophosphate kinase [Candidatus Woesearchaeota archaeon]|nr:nucleoside monophosphate kinase [Candidatus Woesearchaeota archaeon]
MRIAISGKAGSGKSTVANKLAKKLGLKHYSIGDLMRQIAKERKVSLLHLSKIAEKDTSIDKELDKKQIQLKDNDDFVIDGRLSAFFIPNADLKVFLECDNKVRVERVMKDNRGEEKSKDITSLAAKIKQREISERKRYKELYNADYYDKNLYDLMIDTTNLTPDEVVEEIINSINVNEK